MFFILRLFCCSLQEIVLFYAWWAQRSVRDVGWVLQAGPYLMNMLSACLCVKICEVKKIQNPLWSEYVGQPVESICAVSFSRQSNVGSQLCPLVAAAWKMGKNSGVVVQMGLVGLGSGGERHLSGTLELCDKSVLRKNMWLGSKIHGSVFLLDLEIVTMSTCWMDQLVQWVLPTSPYWWGNTWLKIPL